MLVNHCLGSSHDLISISESSLECGLKQFMLSLMLFSRPSPLGLSFSPYILGETSWISLSAVVKLFERVNISEVSDNDEEDEKSC